MAQLVKAVFVRDPERQRDILLTPGEEPEPRLAALVTNPACWEGGKLPADAEKTAAKSSETTDDGDSGETKPAAKKAATTPARGRKSAAGEGSSS